MLYLIFTENLYLCAQNSNPQIKEIYGYEKA